MSQPRVAITVKRVAFGGVFAAGTCASARPTYQFGVSLWPSVQRVRALTTQFFERQEKQRKYTAWLVGAFVTAMILVVLVINLVIILGLGTSPAEVWRREPEVIG